MVNFASAARKAAAGSVTNRGTPAIASALADPTSASTLSGSAVRRAIEEAASLRDIVRGHTLVEPSQTLKIEVHGVGVRSLFRAPGLDGDKLGVQRVCQARNDFVLHVEEIGPRGPSNRYISKDSAWFRRFCPPVLAACQAGLRAGRQAILTAAVHAPPSA